MTLLYNNNACDFIGDVRFLLRHREVVHSKIPVVSFGFDSLVRYLKYQFKYNNHLIFILDPCPYTQLIYSSYDYTPYNPIIWADPRVLFSPSGFHYTYFRIWKSTFMLHTMNRILDLNEGVRPYKNAVNAGPVHIPSLFLLALQAR